jgi:hypothetical protein
MSVLFFYGCSILGVPHSNSGEEGEKGKKKEEKGGKN